MVASRLKANGWPQVIKSLHAGEDASRPIRQRLEDAGEESGRLQREIGAAQKKVELGNATEQAKALREKERAARDGATVAPELASLLRTDRFQAFVREQALRVLGEDGSQHLHALSRGRYDFSVEAQEFHIIDHWERGPKAVHQNSERRRDVPGLPGSGPGPGGAACSPRSPPGWRRCGA